MKNASDGIAITYSDFLLLAHVEDPKTWASNMRIDSHGIWIGDLGGPTLLIREERHALMAHPDGDINKPVISFPTTLGEIRSRLLPVIGEGFMDPFDLADHVAKQHALAASSASNKELRTRERSTLLTIIRGLSAMASVDRRGAASAVEKQLEELGFQSPKGQTIRDALKAAFEIEP